MGINVEQREGKIWGADSGGVGVTEGFTEGSNLSS